MKTSTKRTVVTFGTFFMVLIMYAVLRVVCCAELATVLILASVGAIAVRAGVKEKPEDSGRPDKDGCIVYRAK